MSSERRRWLWVAIVAVVAAAIWWLVPQGTSPSHAPTGPEPSELPRRLEERVRPEQAHTEHDAPLAPPLPRDQVELPDARRALDAGVASEDPGRPAQKREEMMTVVLDRLKQDLSAAEEAGNEERAARLKIRIERLEQRRSELAEE